MNGDVPLLPYTPSWPSQEQLYFYLYFLYRTETWNKEASWDERKKWQERNTRSRTRKKWQKEGTVTRIIEDTVALRQFFLPVVRFPLSVSFHLCSAPYTFLQLHFVLRGQTGEAWEPSKKNCSFGYRAVLDSQVCTWVDQAQHVVSRWAAR